MYSLLGTNSGWISTTDNFTANKISSVKRKTGSTSSKHFSFDYSTLQQKYLELKAWHSYQPKLLSVLWDIVLEEKGPTLEEIRTLT